MAAFSSILAWKIPWTEEPGRLQSMGSQRVGHNRATSLSFFLSYYTGMADSIIDLSLSPLPEGQEVALKIPIL